MPPGLDIDYKLPLNNTIARYTEQVLISTGKEDWTSRIEDEEDGILARHLRGMLGKGGKYLDPSLNAAVTNSSFQPSNPFPTRIASAYTFPSFQYIPNIPTDPDSIENFLKGFLLPEDRSQQARGLSRSTTAQQAFPGVVPVNDVTILICGHGGRDERCGILGPILRDEFLAQLPRHGVEIRSEPPGTSNASSTGETLSARVGLISHIGGHKFAGNVIIYVPPTLENNELAGMGIWYGRIEPGHVEGLVKETVLGARVIKEKFRGGISRNNGMLSL
ncbi:MAG: hypothetical protein M1820_003576 [Bogoriella megaspora]|nr:MAG: hypothetical protein M1820_003576 [Bogoriella megaspora]